MKKVLGFVCLLVATTTITFAQIPTDGLIGYWPFNGNANDESGNGNNGTVNGATITTDRFGNENKAYNFDGYHEIVVPHSDALNIVGDMTVSAWFISEGPPLFHTSHTIVTKRSSDVYADCPYLLAINYQISIPTDNKKPIFWSASNGALQYLQSTNDITNNTWNHILYTILGNNIKMFLNGIMIVDTTINNGLRISNTAPLLIGSGARLDKPAEQFVGKIDDIRIYNRALSQAEIDSLYHEGGWNPINQESQLIKLKVEDLNPSLLPFSATFGWHVNATECMDVSLGETDGPPIPPGFSINFGKFRTSGLSDACYPGGSGMVDGNAKPFDLRKWTSSHSIRDTFRLIFNDAQSAVYPISVTWEPITNPSISSLTLKEFGTSNLQTVNMLTNTSMVITDADIVRLNIFSQTNLLPQVENRINLPVTTSLKGSTVEIPIYITDITNKNILSYQFQIDFNTPNNFLTVSDTVITSGTLSSQSGWTVLANTTVPNRITVGAFGANPLTGQGMLLKLKFRLSPTAIKGQYSNLNFSNFTFNAGTPTVLTTNGKIIVKTKVCGDADENGIVQAYDASLVLREVLSMNNPPLTQQGKENGDVDENTLLQAYDAALILRHAIGLSQPISTCFGTVSKSNSMITDIKDVKINITDVSHADGIKTLNMNFEGITREPEVLALSFDMKLHNKINEKTKVEIKSSSNGYIYEINKIDNKHYRIGIINPLGILSEEVAVQIYIESNERGLNEMQITNLLVNNQSMPDVKSIINTMPKEFTLFQNYPNPFNPHTIIRYALSSDSWVTLNVFDVLGREVIKLVQGYQTAGNKEVEFNAKDLPSGVYYYKLSAGTFTDIKKMILMK